MRSELDRLRDEAAALRIRASEAERLRAECDALEEQARERAVSEESLRIQLDALRSELLRLDSEAAALRDGASSLERLEGELQAAGAEVAQLREECQRSRAAAAEATGEVEALIAHSSAIEDGFYRALAEIETHPSERLIAPREAERLQTRLGELEGQLAEAVAARRAIEEETDRALRARESELATLQEQLRTMQTQMRELAELEAEEKRLQAMQTEMQELTALEAEEKRLRTVIAGESSNVDDVSTELAAFLSARGRTPGRREAGGAGRSPEFPGVVRLPVRQVTTSKLPASRTGGSLGLAAPRSPAVVSPPSSRPGPGTDQPPGAGSASGGSLHSAATRPGPGPACPPGGAEHADEHDRGSRGVRATPVILAGPQQ